MRRSPDSDVTQLDDNNDDVTQQDDDNDDVTQKDDDSDYANDVTRLQRMRPRADSKVIQLEDDDDDDVDDKNFSEL